ncbi:MAG: S41 family peptidase, partial [Thermomicrobiales bacterium]
MSSPTRSKTRFIRSRSALLAVAIITFVSGILIGRGGLPVVGADGNLDNQEAYSTFEEAWDLIQSQYVDPDSIDSDALIHGAAKGMVEALGDTGHSTFLDPLQVQTSDPDLSGDYVGIGVELDFTGVIPRITAPIEGGPADQAGLLAGDSISKVDGTRLLGLNQTQISTLIRGEEGSTVTLTIQRGGEADFDVTLTRATVTVDPVSWWMIDGHIAQIRFSQFTQ